MVPRKKPHREAGRWRTTGGQCDDVDSHFRDVLLGRIRLSRMATSVEGANLDCPAIEYGEQLTVLVGSVAQDKEMVHPPRLTLTSTKEERTMTDSAMLGNLRLRAIWRAHELKNVSRACRELRISRTTYYKWLDRWLRYGPGGLEPHPKRHPQMPNQVSPVVEQAILDYISVWPTHGPRRIGQQLGQPEWGGLLISHWGVYKTLRRRGLHQRAAR